MSEPSVRTLDLPLREFLRWSTSIALGYGSWVRVRVRDMVTVKAPKPNSYLVLRLIRVTVKAPTGYGEGS